MDPTYHTETKRPLKGLDLLKVPGASDTVVVWASAIAIHRELRCFPEHAFCAHFPWLGFWAADFQLELESENIA